jgi:hypothetical protein
VPVDVVTVYVATAVPPVVELTVFLYQVTVSGIPILRPPEPVLHVLYLKLIAVVVAPWQTVLVTVAE